MGEKFKRRGQGEKYPQRNTACAPHCEQSEGIDCFIKFCMIKARHCEDDEGGRSNLLVKISKPVKLLRADCFVPRNDGKRFLLLTMSFSKFFWEPKMNHSIDNYNFN